MMLRHTILNNQNWAICSSRCIATIELQEIRTEIIVIIQLESQAKLRNARQVGEWESSGIEIRKIPITRLRIVCNQTHCVPTGRSLEICQLQHSSIAESAFADVHRNFHVSCEGIDANQTLFPDFQDNLCDDCIIR